VAITTPLPRSRSQGFFAGKSSLNGAWRAPWLFELPEQSGSRSEIISWREDENPLYSLSIVRAEVLDVADE
jgi:hypothetical protein